MNKVRMGTIFMMVVPLVAAVSMLLLCMTQVRRRDLDELRETQARDHVNALQDLLREADATPLVDKDITAYDTADEQAAFLTQLRVNAQAANVKLTQYMNMGPVMPPNTANKPDAQPQDYRAVASTLTVQGPYEGVRAFAYSLLRAKRLMNMNGVTWKRDTTTDTTTLSFTLIRYVKNPETQVSTTTVPAGATGSPGGAIR